VISNETLLRNL